ncbi:MAG: AI-2E family transporter [Steroidobacteraceae bacterium]
MDSSTRADGSNDRFYARTFALVTVVALGLAFVRIIEPFVVPLMWAAFLAFLFHPLHVRITKRLHNREQLSSLLLTLFVFVLFIGPLTALSAAFAAQAGDLLQFVQSTVADQTKNNVSGLDAVPGLGAALKWLESTFGINIAQVRGWFSVGAQDMLQTIASLGGKVFLGAIGTVIGFALMLFVLFFFLRDGEKMWNTLRELIPMSETSKQRLFDHLAAVTRAVVYGSGLTALLQGALVGIAFAIVGLPSPVVFAVITALAALLPFAGSGVVWLPATIVLAAQQRWGAALFMLLWGAVLVSLVDNFIRPWLVSGRAEVGTLTVFIGVLGGISAFGTIGLIIGPVILALIIALLQFTLEVRRGRSASVHTP